MYKLDSNSEKNDNESMNGRTNLHHSLQIIINEIIYTKFTKQAENIYARILLLNFKNLPNLMYFSEIVFLFSFY